MKFIKSLNKIDPHGASMENKGILKKLNGAEKELLDMRINFEKQLVNGKFKNVILPQVVRNIENRQAQIHWRYRKDAKYIDSLYAPILANVRNTELMIYFFRKSYALLLFLFDEAISHIRNGREDAEKVCMITAEENDKAIATMLKHAKSMGVFPAGKRIDASAIVGEGDIFIARENSNKYGEVKRCINGYQQIEASLGWDNIEHFDLIAGPMMVAANQHEDFEFAKLNDLLFDVFSSQHKNIISVYCNLIFPHKKLLGGYCHFLQFGNEIMVELPHVIGFNPRNQCRFAMYSPEGVVKYKEFCNLHKQTFAFEIPKEHLEEEPLRDMKIYFETYSQEIFDEYF